jgi:hypothetical protein
VLDDPVLATTPKGVAILKYPYAPINLRGYESDVDFKPRSCDRTGRTRTSRIWCTLSDGFQIDRYLHNLVGVWTAALLLILVLTGVIIRDTFR